MKKSSGTIPRKARKATVPAAPKWKDNGVMTFAIRPPSEAGRRRVERILRWEDESAKVDFVIAGRRKPLVDAS